MPPHLDAVITRTVTVTPIVTPSLFLLKVAGRPSSRLFSVHRTKKTYHYTWIIICRDVRLYIESCLALNKGHAKKDSDRRAGRGARGNDYTLMTTRKERRTQRADDRYTCTTSNRTSPERQTPRYKTRDTSVCKACHTSGLALHGIPGVRGMLVNLRMIQKDTK